MSQNRRAKADRKRNYVGDRSMLPRTPITETYLRADGFPSGDRKHIVRSCLREVVYTHAGFDVVQCCSRTNNRHFFAVMQINTLPPSIVCHLHNAIRRKFLCFSVYSINILLADFQVIDARSLLTIFKIPIFSFTLSTKLSNIISNFCYYSIITTR